MCVKNRQDIQNLEYQCSPRSLRRSSTSFRPLRLSVVVVVSNIFASRLAGLSWERGYLKNIWGIFKAWVSKGICKELQLLNLISPPDIHRPLKLDQFLPDVCILLSNYLWLKTVEPDLYEAEVKLPPKVICQPPIVVVDSQVGWTHLRVFCIHLFGKLGSWLMSP